MADIRKTPGGGMEAIGFVEGVGVPAEGRLARDRAAAANAGYDRLPRTGSQAVLRGVSGASLGP